jgi:hypothetical protein
MPAFTQYTSKAVLDWLLRGATATQPAGCFVALAYWPIMAAFAFAFLVLGLIMLGLALRSIDR